MQDKPVNASTASHGPTCSKKEWYIEVTIKIPPRLSIDPWPDWPGEQQTLNSLATQGARSQGPKDKVFIELRVPSVAAMLKHPIPLNKKTQTQR